MNPYLQVILWAVGIVVLFIVMMAWNNHKWKKTQKNRIKRIFGKIPEREYSPDDLERISHYFRRKENGEFYIDDITWNDLDMDRIFIQINQTFSSPGEDILYNILRRPVFNEEILEEREKLIHFFDTHEKERTDLQLILASIGKTRLGSLADTVLALNDAPVINIKIHILMLVALLVSIFVLLPMYPMMGFLVFMCLMIANIAIYYASAGQQVIEAYMDCFNHLLKMLEAADQMQIVKYPEAQKQMEAIAEGKKEFRRFRKKAFLITGKNADSGDPFQLLMSYVRMVFHVDILAYNSLLKEIKDKADTIMLLIGNIGELDALVSIASFRRTLSLWSIPVFMPWSEESDIAIQLKIEDLYHPLIRNPVANSITATGGTLVTGSNASGKSTFLKNVAINSILAQTIHTCTATSCQTPFLKVMTSMALRDDISSGESYFIVEIRSLKRILDESRKKEPLLCVIDEVLRGTNTIERIAASSQILNSLRGNWILPFAATHDIELSYILDEIYTNYHFEEEVLEQEVVFNYLLKPGRATTRNAIRLLDMLGYDQELVKNAGNAAAEFERTGIWAKISCAERKEQV